MKRAQVMAPAIKLAERALSECRRSMASQANEDYFHKEPNVGAIFLWSGQPVPATGWCKRPGRDLEEKSRRTEVLLQGRTLQSA